jgi:hypothetical protein
MRGAARVANFGMFAVLCAALCAGLCDAGALGAHAGNGQTLGVELPLAGDLGADGLAARAAIELALEGTSLHADFQDTARGGFANPHVDEGRDASALADDAANIVARFGRDPRVTVVLGGLSAELAVVDAGAVRAGLPLIVLAPLPDGCAAAGSFDGTPPHAGVASVSGSASLEALALAEVVRRRVYRRVAIDDDGNALAHSRAACERRVMALAGNAAHPPDAHAPDAHAFVAPDRLGTLLCAGSLGLDAGMRVRTLHRGYDSNDVPHGCFWVRRAVRANPGQAAQFAAFSDRFRSRTGFRPTDAAYLAYDAARAGLRIARHEAAATAGLTANMRACAGGSADAAWFDVLPPQPDLRSPFLVRDLRCTHRT